MSTPKGVLFCASGVPNIPSGKATARLAMVSTMAIHPKTFGDYTSGGVPKPKLLDEVRARIRRLHYSARTQDAYVDWVRRFVLFHGRRHPRGLGAARIETFLTYLAGM
ncbi:phage integrase N-terminal SAM-like domain-containing protein [Immundisolibacter cernigliae]|uniref:phage integrase N-terminal SAM-like domain-containing protein n=1 Tax=Immundisolibacter cernigliae TaxID=1810504 RepID=UPI003AB0CF39